MTSVDNLNNITLNAIYADGSFEQIKLGKLLNKGGAAGRIFENKNNPKTVAKIFHEKNKSSTNRQKLEAMLHNVPNLPTKTKNGVEYIQIAWPVAVLEDSQGFCVGYLMPKVDTSLAVSLDYFMQKAVRKKLKLPEKYLYRVLAAYNLTLLVAAMHKCGHYIIDLKPSNVFVYKSTMTVVMFDCDGFSIQGKNARYPTDYVSEEYIYPEGENIPCSEMGEEQDNFALAVIIFKLLNNGIHPFSGIPKKGENMLTIQERIFKYHYAYGLWPDLYQQPHPYSIHEYLDKSTLDMFERAFVKRKKRPSAEEWHNHLSYLLQNMKKCSKNPNHAYFTTKGCGLCIMEEKFNLAIENEKKKKDDSTKIRGMAVSDINIEKMEKQKTIEQKELQKLRKISCVGFVLYFAFFSFLYPILSLIKNSIISLGIGLQLLLITITMIIIRKVLHYTTKKIKLTNYYFILEMMQIFAFVCMLVAFILINDLQSDFWSLS